MLSNGSPFRVMTYNIRLDTPRDGERVWVNRRDSVLRLITELRPDILGLQEALPHQLDAVAEGLPDFDFVGVGRDDGGREGEFTPVFFRRARFQLLETDTFWLSKTPSIPGSRSWDAQLNRIATWARLRDPGDGAICFVNTHLEYEGWRARLEGARILRERLPDLARGGPLILTGDFNCPEGSEPYKLLTSGLPQNFLFDARHRSVEPHSGPTATVVKDYTKLGEPETRIDYVLVTGELTVLSHRIVDRRFGDSYPSDHLPVVADLKADPRSVDSPPGLGNR